MFTIMRAKMSPPTMLPKNMSAHSLKSCPRATERLRTGSRARAVCSVYSSERPMITNMKPMG